MKSGLSRENVNGFVGFCEAFLPVSEQPEAKKMDEVTLSRVTLTGCEEAGARSS